jgi:FKBP-type peptidyl-prolyl cis-trans isomerase
LRLWLHRGDPVRWQPPGVVEVRVEDNGETLISEMRIDRSSMMNGLFYGIDGMCVGGTRRLEIAPHLAYGEKGVPGMIPENAMIIAEVTILDQR